MKNQEKLNITNELNLLNTEKMNFVLQKSENYFNSVIESINNLNNKAYNILTFLIPIVSGSIIYIFNNTNSSFILSMLCFISFLLLGFFFLIKAYNVGKIYTMPSATQMLESGEHKTDNKPLLESNFLKAYIGGLEICINNNEEFMFQKGCYINKAINIIFCGFLITLFVFAIENNFWLYIRNWFLIC